MDANTYHYVLSGENQEVLLEALDNMNLPYPIIETNIRETGL